MPKLVNYNEETQPEKDIEKQLYRSSEIYEIL